MKVIFLFFTFLSLAHADDGCSKLLSPKARLEVSIRDLSQLRYELDLNAASGADSLTAQLLKAAYDKKYAELLALEPTLDEKVREEIQKIQNEEGTARSHAVQKKAAEADGIEAATTGVNIVGQTRNPRRHRDQEMLSTGEILFLGSLSPGGDKDSTVEIFNPLSNTSEFKKSLPHGLYTFSHTRLSDDTILIAGGNRGHKTLSPIRIFNPVKNTLRTIGNLEKPRSNGTAVLLPNRKVMFVGGWEHIPNESMRLVTDRVSEIEIFDLKTRTSEVFRSPIQLDSVRCALLPNGTVLAHNGDYVYVIDPVKKKVRKFGRLHTPRTNFGQSVLSDGRILITGGWANNDIISSMELIDPNTGTITPVGQLNNVLGYHGQVTLLDGRILVVGGLTIVAEHVVPSDIIELIDPVSFETEVIGSLTEERTEHHLHVQSDGTVLVTGGNNKTDRLRSIEKIKVGTQ